MLGENITRPTVIAIRRVIWLGGGAEGHTVNYVFSGYFLSATAYSPIKSDGFGYRFPKRFWGTKLVEKWPRCTIQWPNLHNSRRTYGCPQ